MHEIVKYHNDLNTVPMRKFSEIELNIFMAVVQQMRDKSFDMFILFTRFTADSNSQTLDVSVNPEFSYILNDFTGGNFDQYELAEFVALSTTYGKTLYRLLKQYRTTGYLNLPRVL